MEPINNQVDHPSSEDLVPSAFKKYEECPDCEVTVHGPRRANSSGGCHVELCRKHETDR